MAELRKKKPGVAIERLRLEEFEPRVLTSFVRNRLIDSVYLPLVGNHALRGLIDRALLAVRAAVGESIRKIYL